MKICLVTFLVVALATPKLILANVVEPMSHCVECPDEFKGKLICAFLNGCHLEMDYCAMMVFNCARILHRKHMFLVKNEGICKPVRGYKCEYMDF
ncbi:uncharacterized protein LOC108094335 [Drosophila ficusphila]|uniref:uncharacterized protein LOC108094335 n=1 Tax=Drosophila ficusphila TaxID=30025 RepID=UPI0007E7D8F5|nr:uncharacterized protein LOC108094335 [Drosophila ficusphila]